MKQRIMESDGNRPLILVSNDDGVAAKGLRSLIEFLVPLGEVIAVAPDSAQSAKSSAITVNSPLRLKPCPDIAGAKVYAVNGTPVDCVKLGLHVATSGRRPDIVVSGINHGSNAGSSVIYSGTMGAAIEGAVVGIPSVGFSLLDFSADADFTVCREVVERVVARVLAAGLPKGVCLNVNIPAVEHPKELKVVRAARTYWTEEFVEKVDPWGRPYYWLTGQMVNQEPDDDHTDEYWLKRGHATVVPVSVDQSAHFAIDPLKDLLQ